MNRHSRRVIRSASVTAAIAVGTLVTLTSGAASAAPAPTDVVQYGDLNVTTAQGAKELSTRIENAAFQYCREVAPPVNAPAAIENVSCQQSVIAETVAKIDNPTLSQMFPSNYSENVSHGG